MGPITDKWREGTDSIELSSMGACHATHTYPTYIMCTRTIIKLMFKRLACEVRQLVEDWKLTLRKAHMTHI